MDESDFIASLRALARDPAARGLLDDAAVFDLAGTRLVLTHDMIVEGVHFLPDDPPEDVAWKLVAVNLSDLSGKGSRPVGALLSYGLTGNDDWDRAFVDGLGSALNAFELPLLGGDTVAWPVNTPRTLGLTAIGEAAGPVPSRAGAQPGDHLWVSGSIGDAGAGLLALLGKGPASDTLIARYRRPRPRLEAGQALAPLVSAMMDVSDGLLIDTARMAGASNLGVSIELATVPLSTDYIAALGDERETRIAAATAGDDYELLFAAAPGQTPAILNLSEALGLSLSRIGFFSEGSGLTLTEGGKEVPLPDRLGYQHEASSKAPNNSGA